MKRIMFIAALATAGCGSSQNRSSGTNAGFPPPVATAAISPGSTSVAPAASATSLENVSTPIDHGVVEADVNLMIGGRFSPDHIGPEPYEAVRRRFASGPLAYLRTVEGIAASAKRQQLSSLFFGSVIFGAGREHPAEAAAVANNLLPRYRRARGAAVTSPAWDGEVRWLDQQIRYIEQMANGNFR